MSWPSCTDGWNSRIPLGVTKSWEPLTLRLIKKPLCLSISCTLPLTSHAVNSGMRVKEHLRNVVSTGSIQKFFFFFVLFYGENIVLITAVFISLGVRAILVLDRRKKNKRKMKDRSRLARVAGTELQRPRSDDGRERKHGRGRQKQNFSKSTSAARFLLAGACLVIFVSLERFRVGHIEDRDGLTGLTPGRWGSGQKAGFCEARLRVA